MTRLSLSLLLGGARDDLCTVARRRVVRPGLAANFAHVKEIDQAVAAQRTLRATRVAARDSARASTDRGEEAVVHRIIDGAAVPAGVRGLT